jgi:hypothetical protein
MNIKSVILAVLWMGAALASAAAHARSRALLIGAGDVPHHELPAIDLDIANMKKAAEVMGYAPGDIKVLFGPDATYANVRQALATWVRDGVGPNDRVLIYFSGHGTRVPDPAPGNAGGWDDALVMHDVQLATIQGKPSARNVLIGHEFHKALTAIPSRNVLVLVDACHSGTATRAIDLADLSLGVRTAVPRVFSYPGMPSGTRSTRSSPSTRGFEAPSADNYASLSAAQDDEEALGTELGGLFTVGVTEEIERAARQSQHPTVIDVRSAAAKYIAAHTKERERHHPVADGDQRLIAGELALIPLRDGQGPTWRSLAALAQQGEPMALSAAGRDLRLGDEVTLEVALPRDGYLNVVSVDSQDRATVLYPNKFAAANQVRAGRFKFPTPQMNFVVRASEPLGPALVVAFLTDKPVNLLELGVEGRDAAGKMQQVFTEVSARATRALSVEARQSRFAGASLTVKVAGKASP